MSENNTLKHNTVIIYSGHNTIPSHVKIREGWQARLAESKSEDKKIEVYEEYLDDIRLHLSDSFDEPFINLWNKKYEHITVDMIVTIGPTADALLNRHFELFAGVPYYNLSITGLTKNTEYFQTDIFKMIDIVSRTLPDTEYLAVLAGEKGNIYHQTLIENISPIKPLLSPKLKVDFWNNLSFDELYEKAKQLPDKSAILYFPISVDRLGERKIPFEVLRKLVKVSSVPIFVHDNTYLGLGVVGGYVRNLKQEGDIIGRLILGLKTPQSNEEYDAEVRGYVFDNEALQRWHIPEKNLPPDSKIINLKESFVRKNKWAIFFAMGLILESFLIIKLICSLRYGRKLATELADERNLLDARVIERTRELEKSRILFQDAANVAKLGVFNYDLISDELSWDASMFAIYGIDSQTCKSVYRAWRNITLPEDVQKTKAALQLAIEEYKPFDTRFHIRRKDGKIRTIHTLGQIYRDANEKPLCVVGINQDITEREEAEIIIRNLAYYDPLTQLPNRRLLAEQLKQSISSCRRERKRFAVMMMDLDKFKAVNDTLGHTAGDELLVQVSERIKARLREHDTVARLGGDEFVVLLEGVHSPDDTAHVANALIETLTQPFVLTQSDNVQIGTSIGITFYPEHGEDGDVLMDKADSALYVAKNNGRGCFSYYSEQQ